MANICKTCKKQTPQGIWLSPQFADEKALLFCSDKCKNEYMKSKLERIKSSYPKYYDKLMKNPKENSFFTEHIKSRGGKKDE